MRTASLFSWLFIISILLGVKVFLVSSQCLGHQQTLLVQLRRSLEFDHGISTKLVKWNVQSSDCCFWEGVSCIDGHVVDLNLSNEGISGELDNSSSLFNLQHLKSLDLSCNFFSSMIPSGIGNLKKLKYLNLSSAGFLGKIPSEMSQLRRLITLDLSTTYNYDPTIVLAVNELKLENPTLKMLVQNLSKLEELYFDGVNMSASGNEWCQALSSSLPNLRILSLSDCSLSGPLDQSLVKLQSLSVIRLDNNDFVAPVPVFFANFSRLSALSFHSCQLYGTFPGEIFKVPTLKTLDLTDNVLLSGSLPEFPRNNSLQILMLPFTAFSRELPTSIGNLWNLSTLDLSFCNFSGTIPSSIAKLTQLSSLQLSFNNFTGPLPSFNKSKKLTQIDLSRNGLTGEIPPAHFKGLLNLIEIDLKHNFLKGSVPSSLFELPSLKTISLSKNQFSILEFQIASSSVLTTLDLSSNNLEGSFPMSIFKLRNLSSLDLSYNKLNGTVQLDIFQEIDQLAVLDLSYNNWSVNASVSEFTLMSSFPQLVELRLAFCNIREFPHHLKNQLELVSLDLSNNRIHGEIPNWVWEVGNSTNLAILNLSHNHLVGLEEPYSLPNSLSLLDLSSNYLGGKIPVVPASIGYIDFSNNNYTSSIPIDFFDDLSSLGFFSISNNNLKGVIPESICSASGLQVLDLSHNKLSGKIPKCLFEIGVSLEVLNLRHNNLRGSIQDALAPADCDLKTLDLNGNFIQGKIPNSLTNCTELQVLDLGHNNMIGEFPCLLKSSTALQVLILRSNKFSGTIGCPYENGTWEMLQILDLAQNNFSGELPGQWLKTMQAMMVNDNIQANVNSTNSNVLGFTHLYTVTLNVNQMSISSVYYRYTVTVTSKSQEMKLTKILNTFISIDLSSNNLQGPIPAVLGQLQALTVLNLSNNAHTGEIPSSIGDLRQLESLDLSRNNFIGSIPTSLEQLTFLSFLNLSFNQLVGRIPKANQFQTFSADSYVGNKRLCGFPLMKHCLDEGGTETLLPNTVKDHKSIDWNLLSVEVGFVVGFGIVFGPLLFCKRWRQWHYKCVDDIFARFFPSAVSNKWFLWTKS